MEDQEHAQFACSLLLFRIGFLNEKCQELKRVFLLLFRDNNNNAAAEVKHLGAKWI